MRLIILRHATPDWPQGEFVIDPPLSELGRKQAVAAAEELASRVHQTPVKTLYASPARRACETAEIIAQRLGLKVELDETLAAGGVSDPELRRKLVEREWDDWLRKFALDAQGVIWPRVTRLLEESAPDDAYIFVSHDSVMKPLLCAALEMPVESFFKFRLDPASISILDFTQRGPRLALLNETCHLESLG